MSCSPTYIISLVHVWKEDKKYTIDMSVFNDFICIL